jgi:hypothetical protein
LYLPDLTDMIENRDICGVRQHNIFTCQISQPQDEENQATSSSVRSEVLQAAANVNIPTDKTKK